MKLGQLHKHLLERLADGRTHSGSELAARLGLSRTGVWKLAQELRSFGVEVHAHAGMGYRLARALELLDGERITAALSPGARGLLTRLQIFDVVDSTNGFLLQAARDGAGSGHVCLAEGQTAGRGRLGRRWVSPWSGNLYLSILWHYPHPGSVNGLSLMVGAVLTRVLRAAGVAAVGLKWPNDLLWGDRKLGGILVEVAGEANGPCAAVVGIGLNWHLPPKHAESIEQSWIDLAQIPGGQARSRNELVAALLSELLPALADFGANHLKDYLPEWRSYHCLEGRRVTVELGTRHIDGVVRGVTESGLLLLECADGERREFASGAVRLRFGAA